jgi:hypothetical protein
MTTAEPKTESADHNAADVNFAPGTRSQNEIIKASLGSRRLTNSGISVPSHRRAL